MDSAHTQVRLFRALERVLNLLGEAHVWLLFKKDLRLPLQPFSPRVPCVIEQAYPADMDELAHLHHPHDEKRAADLAASYRERFGIGAHCFVARVEGRIVAFDWLRLRAAVGAGGVPMLLKDDEVYGSDAYTAADWRGHGIHPALNYGLLKYAQEQGYATVYTQARANNAQSLPTLRRLQWTLTATMLVFEPRWNPAKQLWLGRGSPYPMPVAGLSSTRLLTLAEYFQQHPFEKRELVKASPWSRTYALQQGNSRSYLKMVPSETAACLRVAEVVARAYPDHVPKVIAGNHFYEAWQLTQDEGGTALSTASPQKHLLQMVQTYAHLQIRSLDHPALLKQLPQTPVEGLVQALLQFLGSDADTESPQRAGAAFFLGAAEAQRYADAVSRARSLLQSHVARANELPLTLNHGHLQPEHAVLTATGQCLLINWTRAVAGPAGLSLHALLGAQVPRAVFAVLCVGSAQGHVVDGPPADPLLSHYIQTLARGGYADEGTLRRCLPAAMTVGMLLDLLFLAGCVMDDPDELETVSQRLRTQLNHLLELCNALSAAQDPMT